MQRLGLRRAYGEVLAELGKEHKNIAVVAIDLSKSTQVNRFAKEFPERFFNLGVAEEDAISTAAGLAAQGDPVFVSTFAVFGVYLGLGQIIQSIALNNLPVKMVFSHGGIDVGQDGASHQALQDIAIMRSIPGMKVIVPADYYETKAAVKAAIKIPGPVYIRLSREAGEVIYEPNIQFELGKADFRYIGKFDEKPKIILISCGLLLAETLKAAEILSLKNIPSLVFNMSSIKPLDLEFTAWAKKVEYVFTIEDHSIIGGLGSAVAEALSEIQNSSPIKRLGIPDQFGQSGKPKDLYQKFGLTKEKIAQTVLESLN